MTYDIYPINKKGKEMKVIKVEHATYKKWKRLKYTRLPLLTRWQFIYSSKKGAISLVKLLNYFLEKKDYWEIYCLKGNLFDDVERFSTKKEAEKRIKAIL